MGTEVEYGISIPSDPAVNPVISSTHVVLAYAASVAAPRARRPRWDYEVESPSRDARGYDLSNLFGGNLNADPDDIGAANVILSNGARLYVDHAHPEFSAPEVTNPRDAVIFDKAGERVMERAAALASQVPGAKAVHMYKNNVDGKGASYGTHENYLCSRDTPFPDLVRGLLPFFASRQVFTGAGRVGIGAQGERDGYQLSQRSDYIEVEVGLETTLKRGIINTRDEPHADADKYRRLHVIIGDANLAETTTYLKVGTTALVLSMIESGWPMPDVELAGPVAAVHAISHDPALRTTVSLHDGRKMTGLDIQRVYAEAAAEYVADSLEPTSTSRPPTCCAGGWTCWTGWLRTPWTSPTSWTGRPSCDCSRVSGSGTGSAGPPRGWRWSTCSTPTCGWTRVCTTDWCPAGR